MLDLIGLPDLGDRYPYQLSGASSSAWPSRAPSPPARRVLLLDEPLSALDAKVRVRCAPRSDHPAPPRHHTCS
jgi:putative spermidine/putrescine transport system ATP-binding protein